MFIGACRLKIEIPYSKSLKEKRAVVKSLISKISNTYNISASQTGFLDNKNFAEIGFSMVSNSKPYIEGAFEKILNYINESFDIIVIEEDFEVMKF